MTQRHGIMVLAVALFLLLASAPAVAAGGDSAAQAAFEKLKSLAGTWHGVAAGEGQATVTHEFRVSAAGTVVMETMNPGGDDEMINMYHLDGDGLMLTHYCAGGNQPRMELVEASENELRFDFLDATNLESSAEPHIHASRLRFVDADTIESDWTSFAGGKEAGQLNVTLKRE